MCVRKELKFLLMGLALLFFSVNGFAQHRPSHQDRVGELSAIMGPFSLPVSLNIQGQIGFTLPVLDQLNGTNFNTGVYAFSPNFTFGFKWSTYGICQEQGKVTAWNHFELCGKDSPKSYLILRDFKGGIGLAGGQGLTSFGILPAAGAKVYAKVSKKKTPLLPRSQEEFLQMSVGDDISYRKELGVYLEAGIGIPFVLSIGPTYYYQGTWHISFQKTSMSEIKISFASEKLNISSLLGNSLIANVHSGILKDTSRNFSFTFDMLTEDGVKAFRKLLRGKVIDVKKESVSSPHVTMTSEGEGKTKGRFIEESLGHSWVAYLSWRNSITTNTSTTTSFINGKKVNTYLSTGVGQRLWTAGLIRDSVRAQISSVLITEDENGEPHPSLVLMWKELREKGKVRKVKKFLQKVFKTIGMRERELYFPDIKRLGFTDIEIQFSVGHTGLERFIEIAKGPGFWKTWHKKIFENAMVLENCTKRRSCFRKWHRRAESQVEYLQKKLKVLEDAMEKKDWAKVSKSAERMLRSLVRVPGSVKHFAWIVEDFKLGFRLESEKLKPQQIQFGF